MKKIFIYLVCLLGGANVFGQGEWVSASINVGSAPNITSLFIRTTNAFDPNKVGNIVFTVRVPKTAGNAVVVTRDAASNTIFPHLSFVVQKLTASDATYWYYLVNGTGNVQAAAGVPLVPGLPVKVIDVSYVGMGNATGIVQLANIENDLPGNAFIRPQFYIENNLGEITNLTTMMYGTGGATPTNNQAVTGDDFVGTPVPVALPVRLLNFTAVKSGNNGLLNWTVENQTSTNDHFEIERSFNGVNFEKLGNLAVNFSGPTGSYSYTDLNILASRNNGVIYYRIKQVDKDGQFVYSEVRSIRLSPKTTIGLYPNPAVVFSTLTIDLAEATPITVRVSDAGGKQLDTYTIQGNKGLNTKRIDLGKYAAGTYMLSVQTGIETETFTLVKAQ